ncbi:MAG: STAS domain-containing protein [Anaerolineales bacterium]|nr:STAS domain-containing protein [Anaerolineales bacterium]
MNVSTDHFEGRVPVTIMNVQGDVDASNYQDLIARARELYAGGARHILIDLSKVPYMGSSGLVALHSIAVLLRGQQSPDPDAGWQAYHQIGRDVERGAQHAVKLLSPQPPVTRVLQTSGMDRFFEVHADRSAALASF